MTPNPNRASQPTAALVAEFFEKCGANIGNRFPKYEIGGVRVYDETFGVGTGVVNVCGACCRLDIIDMPANPGIRNALVGAVLAWLRANSPHKLRLESYGKGLIVQVSDWRGASIVDESDVTDPLRALCLAALAVADSKDSTKKEGHEA